MTNKEILAELYKFLNNPVEKLRNTKNHSIVGVLPVGAPSSLTCPGR